MQVGDSGGGLLREVLVVGSLGLTTVLGIIAAATMIDNEPASRLQQEPDPPPAAEVQWKILRGPRGGDNVATACVDGFRIWVTINRNSQLTVLEDGACVNE